MDSLNVSPAKERAHDARRIAAALDVLVRTARVDRPNAERVAVRSAAALRSLHGALRLLPRAVLYDDTTVLTASGTDGAWCLPAYMAGLRGIGVRPELTVEELLEFAQRLGELRVDAALLGAFRDQVWAGSFDGLILEIAPSVVEVARTLEVVDRASESVAAPRLFAPFSEDGSSVAVPVPRSVARDPELEALVESLKTVWKARSFEPDDGDFEHGRHATRQPRGWARCELELPMRVEGARSFVPAKRAAKRLKAWLSGRLRADEVRWAKELLESDDPYVLEVIEAATASSIGRRVGLGMPLDREGGTLALALLSGNCKAAAKQALALALVERASQEEGTRSLLWSWTDHRERDALVNLVLGGAEDLARVNKLSSETARTVKALLDKAAQHQPAQASESLLRWAKLVPCELLASGVPGGLFDALGAEGVKLLIEAEPVRREALLGQAMANAAGVDTLAKALTETNGTLFAGESLFKALAALLKTDQGAAAILALAADRKAPEAARAVALEIAASRDDLAEEALGSRLLNFLDSDFIKEHRAALKRARKALGRS